MYPERLRELFSAVSSSERDIKKTELLLTHRSDVRRYMTEEEVQESYGDSQTMQSDILELKKLEPLPGDRTEEILLKSLEPWYVGTENALKLFLAMRGRVESVLVSNIPEYIMEVARLAT